MVPSEEDGHGRTDEQGLRPGVGAVVKTGEVRAARGEVHGPRGRGEGQGRDDDEAAGAAAPEERHEHEDEQRDEEVELLLHAEGPRVPQRGGVADLLEVRVVLADEPPVLHEEERGEHVTGVSVPVGRPDEEPGGEDRGAQDEQGGDQPLGTPLVEAGDVDRAGLRSLGDEQPGDEVPGEDEEVVDADPAADECGDAEVVQQDERDEEPAVPVEGREPLRAGGGGQLPRESGGPHEPDRA